MSTDIIIDVIKQSKINFGEIHETVEKINEKIDTEIEIFKNEIKASLMSYGTYLRSATIEDLEHACMILRRTRYEDALKRLSEHIKSVDEKIDKINRWKPDMLDLPAYVLKVKIVHIMNNMLHINLLGEHRTLINQIEKLDTTAVSMDPTTLFIVTNMMVQSFRASGYEYIYPHEEKKRFADVQQLLLHKATEIQKTLEKDET